MSKIPISTLDLEAARSKARFQPKILNQLLNEGSRNSEMRSRVAKIVQNDPQLSKAARPYMSRAERLASGLKLSARISELKEIHGWNYQEYLEAVDSSDEATGMHLHEVAFQPVIASQGSDEQQKYWMPLCINHEIIGCYAQTELGHGSNLQSLETTATYDIDTKEFVINSPTVSSTKWWIGGLGLLATHAIVQARLRINGKDFGPHTFIVQIRSLNDHSLMENIQAGEIGPKAHGGMTATDNGWMRMKNVRIPHSQMLNRFSKVTLDGRYEKGPHSKLSYGGMIYIRARMIGDLGWQLSKAVTIATRYLHIRRQFADPELKPGQAGFGIERQVITYPSVYMRILPQIAKAYVFITSGKDMAALYNSMAKQLSAGDTTLLAETHAVSSGLKSYVSSAVVEGIEIVRRSCGGHGFMDAAAMGRLYARELPSVTYEGDNFILNLQVARAALKTLASLRSNPRITLSPSSAYFQSYFTPATTFVIPTSPSKWVSHPILLHLISLRATHQVLRLERMLKSGKQFGDLSWECVAVSKAIVEAFLVRRMLEAIDLPGGLLNRGNEMSDGERAVIRDLIDFYALHTVETALPDLLEFGIIQSSTSNTNSIESLRSQIDVLARKVLSQSVSLVDSFGWSDFDLDSALGRYDGQPYETLLKRAQNDSDMNTGGVEARRKMYEESIKPILERGKRLGSRL